MKKAVFMDRDGVINVDKHYTHRPEDLEFEEGAIEALRLLRQKTGLELVIITSQSGIGRGYFTHGDYKRFMEHMYAELKKEGINFDGEYMCPHKPDDGCKCRKPSPYMLQKASKELGIELSTSYVIGDKSVDVEMGKNAGCISILVMTGEAGKDKRYDVKPDYVAENLLDAAQFITKRESGR